MWPPSSELSLLACMTIAIAFQRIAERILCSSSRSPENGASSWGGIVLTYGVGPWSGGGAPTRRARSMTVSTSCCARCTPSLATTASSASSHSLVSCGSTSAGCIASPSDLRSPHNLDGRGRKPPSRVRIPPMASIYEPEWDAERDEPPYRWRRSRIGRRTGARQLGASLFEVAPGATTLPLHVHYANEEMLVVVAGRPTLETLDGPRPLAPARSWPSPPGA